MTTRNKYLQDVATALSIAGDFSNSPRNDILQAIYAHYGGTSTGLPMNDMLAHIDNATSGSSTPKSRNGHLLSIAQAAGAAGLDSYDSRNTILAAWALNAGGGLTWLLATGFWNDSANWVDTANWID